MKRVRVNGQLCALPFQKQLPPHTDAQLAGMREDIRARGVLVAVFTFVGDDGRSVLDGATRALVAEELGLTVPETHLGEMPGALALDLCRALNIHRRHIEPRQWEEVVLKMRRDKESVARIHAVSGIPLGAVRRIIEEHKPPTPGLYDDDDEGDDYEPLPEVVVGSDGKKHPAKRAPCVSLSLPKSAHAVAVGEALASALKSAATLGSAVGRLLALVEGKRRQELLALSRQEGVPIGAKAKEWEAVASIAKVLKAFAKEQ